MRHGTYLLDELLLVSVSAVNIVHNFNSFSTVFSKIILCALAYIVYINLFTLLFIYFPIYLFIFI